MNSVLLVHLGLGILVAACAALLSWVKFGRRLILYLLTLQMFVGIALLVGGLRSPTPHYVLALAAWFGYMGANRLARAPDQGTNVMVLAVLSMLMLVLTAYLGLKVAGLV